MTNTFKLKRRCIGLCICCQQKKEQVTRLKEELRIIKEGASSAHQLAYEDFEKAEEDTKKYHMRNAAQAYGGEVALNKAIALIDKWLTLQEDEKKDLIYGCSLTYGCPCCKEKEEQIVWLKEHLNDESIEIKLDTVIYLNKTIDEAFKKKT